MNASQTTSQRQVRLERVALGQHGLITAAQAADIGVSHRHLAASTRWVRLRVGLYGLAAYQPTNEQDLMASVLRAGGPAVASHRAAAALHRLDGVPPGVVEITVPRRSDNHRFIGVVHRSAHLEGIDVGEVNGIPVTTVTRTLIDLGAVCDADAVERALEAGLRSGRTSISFLHKRLAALGGRGRPGTAVLRKVLAARLYEAPTGSELETRFVQLCRRFGLPQGARQHEVVGARVARIDFAWPAAHVLVELEGHGHHGSQADHRRDMRRQNFVVLARPGWTVLRYGWDDVVERPGRIAEELKRAFGDCLTEVGTASTARS